MQRTIFLILTILLGEYTSVSAQDHQDIYLLIRADDMGSARAANLACLQTYQDGIVRSVEVMVPCPWFEEAAKLLHDHPKLDVGVHLVLTSEWDKIKWRPISSVPSLTDKDGYFYPRIAPYKNYQADGYLVDADWKIEEIEQEFRAQIELAIKKIPQVSHLTGHMGSNQWHPQVKDMVTKLAREYKLDINPQNYDVKKLSGIANTSSFKERLADFIQKLENLQPGIYLFVEHPGMDSPEMQGLGHPGYEGVALDRDNVTRLFTHKKVLKVIQKKGIKLISYKDLKDKR